MKYKKIAVTSFLIIVSLLFILLPWPASNLKLRVHFGEVKGDVFQLFYTTKSNGVFCQEQSVNAEVDREKNQITFTLDASLYGELTGLRIDFPCAQEVLSVKSITASSAGVVQEEYNPIQFFEESNIVGSNEIEISPVPTRNTVYIATTENDPYVILSPAITQQIADNYSCFGGTRVCICMFFWGCCFLTKKNVFGEKKE